MSQQKVFVSLIHRGFYIEGVSGFIPDDAMPIDSETYNNLVSGSCAGNIIDWSAQPPTLIPRQEQPEDEILPSSGQEITQSEA